MPNDQIEEFARVLVEKVRDATIQSCDSSFRPDAVDAIAKRWRQAAITDAGVAFAMMLIPDIVDSTISHLLGAIDQEFLHLSHIASDGKTLDLTKVAYESGELSGWYSGTGGWREKYSKERFVDDFAD